MPRQKKFTRRLRVSIPREMAAALRAEATRRGMSMASLARLYLSQYLNQKGDETNGEAR